MKFLQGDTFLTRALNRLIECVLLSALWLVTSLPVVTIGAATTARYDVVFHLIKDDDKGILSAYFSSFKNNFKRSTLAFIIMLALGAFLAVDLWSAAQWKTGYQFLFVVVILGVGYFYLMMLSHIFAGIAFFDGSVTAVLKKVFSLAIRNGIYTVFVMVMFMLPFAMFFKTISTNMFGGFVMVYLLFGNSAIVYLNSLHLEKLFSSYDKG